MKTADEMRKATQYAIDYSSNENLYYILDRCDDATKRGEFEYKSLDRNLQESDTKKLEQLGFKVEFVEMEFASSIQYTMWGAARHKQQTYTSTVAVISWKKEE